MTPAVSVHGAVAVPFSNPGLPISCVVPPAALMVSEIVVVWVSEPDVPVIVIVLVPVVAVLLAVKVIVLLEVAGFGLMLAVTPLGRAEFESVTDPVNPPDGVIVIVLWPLVPCCTVKLEGEADNVKFGVVPPAAGGSTQLLAEFENSSWITYVVPFAV